MSAVLTPIRGKHAATLELLTQVIQRVGGLVPDDEVALRVLCGPQVSVAFSEELRRLIALGLVRRVFIGGEPHLLLAAARGPSEGEGAREQSCTDLERSEAKHLERPAQDPASEVAAAREHGLQVALDVAHEKLLLYRVLVAVEVIAGLVLARSAMAWLLG